jgi:hypothetical protein
LCPKTKTITRKGNKKCKAKNRVKVVPPTEYPPQIQITKILPIYGMEDKNFVITVAAQNDI